MMHKPAARTPSPSPLPRFGERAGVRGEVTQVKSCNMLAIVFESNKDNAADIDH